MNSFVTDNQNQIEELKSALKEEIHCQTNKSSVYTINYSLKNWIEADLSCKVEGSHLVSFETVDERNHVAMLMEKDCSVLSFWISARDLGGDNWIWRNSGESVLGDLWRPGQPDGDGDCGHMHPYDNTYQLNDLKCSQKMCYICESP